MFSRYNRPSDECVELMEQMLEQMLDVDPNRRPQMFLLTSGLEMIEYRYITMFEYVLIKSFQYDNRLDMFICLLNVEKIKARVTTFIILENCGTTHCCKYTSTGENNNKTF